MMQSWKTLLDYEIRENGESWDDVESNTMTEAEMEKEFIFSADACAFTIWTKKYVYFPCEYDGDAAVGHVSRHPDGKPTEFQ